MNLWRTDDVIQFPVVREVSSQAVRWESWAPHDSITTQEAMIWLWNDCQCSFQSLSEFGDSRFLLLSEGNPVYFFNCWKCPQENLLKPVFTLFLLQMESYDCDSATYLILIWQTLHTAWLSLKAKVRLFIWQHLLQGHPCLCLSEKRLKM